MASVTEKVKESLVGAEDLQTSTQVQAEFMQYAAKDEESGEYYMTQHEFVEAIAPENEDYVSPFHCYYPYTCTRMGTGG